MNIKNRVITNIQRNLNLKYIKRFLRIISIKPLLYAYGNTRPSAVDKYLNIFTVESLKKAYSDNSSPVGYGSLFLPYELFHALGITPFLPEVMAGYIAALGLAPETIKKASSCWYSQDLCTFHRSATAALEMDLFPEPDFIITTNLACDAAQKSFYINSLKYNVKKNFYMINVPYYYSEQSVLYLSNQIEKIYNDICLKMGKKPDISRFKEVINLSNEFRKWAIEANNLRKTLVRYPPFYNGLNFILPFHAFAGTKEAVILYREMYKEFERYLDKKNTGNNINKKLSDNNKLINNKPVKNTKPVSNKLAVNNKPMNNNDADINKSIIDKPIKRLLWLHLKPYYNNEIFNILEKENCKVVFEEMNYVYWPVLDPDRPFESLARKMLSHFLAGSIERRISVILELVREYRVDGVILFAHWGCRQNNGAARLIKDSLKKINVPILVLDGDCVDPNNSSQGQIRTRLQAFIEILNS